MKAWSLLVSASYPIAPAYVYGMRLVGGYLGSCVALKNTCHYNRNDDTKVQNQILKKKN